jgi:AcrR family transcriptional regulator
MRADAVRNRERLVAAAIAAFTENGADASLDDIARRAGVGPGTLYRHFPTRQALQEAAYLDGFRTLCARADELGETLPPFEALTAWMHYLAGYLSTKRGLSAALLKTLDKTAEIFVTTHAAIRESGGKLVQQAIDAGEIRDDLDITDILKLVNGISLACESHPDRATQTERLLTIVIAGLRIPPAS